MSKSQWCVQISCPIERCPKSIRAQSSSKDQTGTPGFKQTMITSMIIAIKPKLIVEITHLRKLGMLSLGFVRVQQPNHWTYLCLSSAIYTICYSVGHFLSNQINQCSIGAQPFLWLPNIYVIPHLREGEVRSCGE